MAINTFTFGGVTSSTYGIYVSGEKLFNAPARDAEVIQIPGRDGDYILDKGSFKNIKVTYRVFNQEKNLSDFRTKLANLRSALCSKRGYQRLTDTFHPDEYRMAAFIDSIEVTPVKYNTASEFDITFECKPQRWLTSGETATSVANNGTLSNPTLFDSEPLLAVKGYGVVSFNGYTIELHNEVWGLVQMWPSGTERMINSYPAKKVLRWAKTYGSSTDNKIDTGDEITCGDIVFNLDLCDGGYTVESESQDVILRYVSTTASPQTLEVAFTASPTASCYKGTSGNFFQYTRRLFVKQGGTTVQTVTVTFTGKYVQSTIGYFVMDAELDYYDKIYFYDANQTNSRIDITAPFVADSTKSYLGNPTYIDCATGECYKIYALQPVSLNDKIDIGSDLPRLKPGTNTFTYDNTVTELKVTPRWWIV